METFSLPCNTCRTRLKVRDPSVVGKILACPKCGAMVLVKPPPDWQEGNAVADSAANQGTPSGNSSLISPAAPLMATAFDDIDQLLDGAGGAPHPPPATPGTREPKRSSATNQSKLPQAKALEASAAGAFSATNQDERPDLASAAGAPVAEVRETTATVSEAASSQSKLDSSRRASSAASTVSSATVVATPTAAPPPPLSQALNPNWEAERPWRWWLLLGASGITGIVLAVAVVVVASRLLVRDDPPQIAMENTELDLPPEPEVPDEAIPDSSAKSPDDKPTSNHVPQATVPPATPVEIPEATLPPLPPVQPAPSPDDPLGIAEQVPEKRLEPSKVFGPLDKFGDLLNSGAGEPRDATLDEAPPPAIPVDTTTADSADDAPARPAPRQVEVAARLADPLVSIEADGIAFYDLLQQLTELSTIPISLRPEGMMITRLSPHTPVKLQQQNTTVGKALAEILANLRMEMQTIDDQIVVRMGTEKREINVPLDDLVNGEATEGMILEHITELFAPGTWGDTPAQGSIRYAAPAAKVRHEPLVLWQIIDLTQRLRFVRGLPIKGNFEAKLFDLATRWERGRVARETPVSFNYAVPTPLTTIVGRLGTSAKIRILIDWHALSDLGWTPDTETTLLADKLTVEQALEALATRMELAWHVIDAETFELTTPAALQNRPELELYRLSPQTTAAEAAEIMARIEQSLGDIWFRAAGGSGVLRYDPAANCLLALLPPAQQLELQELLAEERQP